MIRTIDKPAAEAIEFPTPKSAFSLLAWPVNMWLFLIGVAALYASDLRDAEQLWASNDNYAYGFFIIPLSAGIVWMLRADIRRAERRPSAWGLALLTLGLACQTASYLLQIRYVGLWSLVPTLAGGILLLHGPRLWKLTSFPVWFLLLAAPLPHVLDGALTHWIQGVSTVGSFWTMSNLGYALIRHGNLIQVPGLTLEVAEACSGFHKLMALTAFAALYGYVFTDNWFKRALLIIAVVPVAVVANVLRISGLIAVASGCSLPTFHAAHGWADIFALGAAFAGFTVIGKGLGCKTPRFGLPSV